MKKLTAGILVALMVVMGAALATAAELPQALKGVNLSTAQVLTPAQAQQIKGANNHNWSGVPSSNDSYNSQYFNAYYGGIPNNYHAFGSRVWANSPF